MTQNNVNLIPTDTPGPQELSDKYRIDPVLKIDPRDKRKKEPDSLSDSTDSCSRKSIR